MDMLNTKPQEAVYANPIIVNKQDEERKIKKQSRTISSFVGCAIFFICILLTVAVIYIGRDYFPAKPTPLPTDNSQITPTEHSGRISNYSTVAFNESYITRVLPVGVSAYKRPQIDLLFRIFQMAEDRQWAGSLSVPLGYTYKDFEQEFNSLLADYSTYMQNKALTPEMELLLIGGSKTTIINYLSEARADFINQVKLLGFSAKYTDEIESYVLPETAGRIEYISDNYDKSNYVGSSTRPLNGDYGRRVIQIDPSDIYYVYQDLSKTLFGMRLNQSDLIKASTKMVMYHEMGHVLMQAFINLHVTDDIKRLGSDDMWMHSDVDFMQTGIPYFWAWQHNKEVQDERIAQGLMLKIFYNQYQISDDDQDDIFNLVVEKDNYNMNTIFALGTILHTQYDQLLLNSWDGLHNYLMNYMTSSTTDRVTYDKVNKMLGIVEKLPAYIGYFNPAVDKDWQFFKQ